MTLLEIYFKEISIAPWRATKYSFVSLYAANRTEVGRFLVQELIQNLPCLRQLEMLTFLLLLLGRRVGLASTFLGWTVFAYLLLCSLTALFISSCASSVNH